MYVNPDYPSKAAIKRAIAEGKRVTVYQPGIGPAPPKDGTVTVEGPHAPKPHTWYGKATVKDGKVVAIK